MCEKCSGLCVEVLERDPIEGVELNALRCLNCGRRDYSPTFHPEITVTKGAYYERGW